MRVSRYLLALVTLLTLAPIAAQAQTYTLAPIAKQQFLDSNADPVPGGKLCTYLSGTTTAASTYSDTAGTLNTNPIILSAAGRPTNGGVEVGIYLAAGSSYKFVLLTAGTDSTCATGTTVWSQDGIGAVPASGSSVDISSAVAGEALTITQCVYLSDGSGAKTAGRWYRCDSANTYSSTLPEVGIALATVTTGQTLSVRTAGSVTGLSGLSVGTKYYVSATVGGLTSTAPANRRELGESDTTTSLVLAGNPAIQSALASGTASAAFFLRGDQTWSNTWTTASGTTAGTQNDWAPGLSGNTVFVMSNTTDLTVTGIAGGTAGQYVAFINNGSGGNIYFAHNSGSSLPANKLINDVTGGSTPVAAGGSIVYVHNGSNWRLVAHEQGAWITRTFAAGNYTASAGTWTVAVAGRDAFYLKGRALSFGVVASGTTSGTPVSVKVTLPQGYSAVSTDITPSYTSANGAGAAEAGYSQANTTTLNFQRLGNTTFAAGTVSVSTVATFEIQ